MQNRTVLVVGIVMVVAGVFFLLGNLFKFDAWQVIWPLALVGLGVWFLFRPRFTAPNLIFVGDIKRGGAWQVTAEEFVTFVSDIDLDLTQALIPIGETTVTCSGFVGDVTIIVPPGVGLKVTSSAFITDVAFLGVKTSNFISAPSQATPGYDNAERKVHLQARYFVGDIKVKAS